MYDGEGVSFHTSHSHHYISRHRYMNSPRGTQSNRLLVCDSSQQIHLTPATFSTCKAENTSQGKAVIGHWFTCFVQQVYLLVSGAVYYLKRHWATTPTKSKPTPFCSRWAVIPGTKCLENLMAEEREAAACVVQQDLAGPCKCNFHASAMHLSREDSVTNHQHHIGLQNPQRCFFLFVLFWWFF